MTDERKAGEPSMDEILSSIRQIITEQPSPSVVEQAPSTTRQDGRVEAAPREDVLELTEIVKEPALDPGPAGPAAAGGVALGRRSASAPAIGPATGDESPGDLDGQPLLSAAASAASADALARLARTASPGPRPAPSSNGGRSLEELVLELMRPMLKDWLDQNLPPIVERVVEQEVKKLARRAENL
jgi:uncharacterized protein